MTMPILYQAPRRHIALGLLLAVVLVGCPDEESERALESVALAQEAATLDVGDTYQLVALASYDDATATDVSAIADWSSSDPAVATVDQNGLVTALAEGTTSITVAYEGHTATGATVTVMGEPPDPNLIVIKVFPGQSYLEAGGSQQYLAVGTYDDGASEELGDVIWRSSDVSVATVTQDGLVTAVAKGSAELTAEIGAMKSAAATLFVSEAELIAVQIDPPTGTLHAGSDAKLGLQATAFFSDGTTSEVTKVAVWSSNAPAVATVDQGLVSAGDEPGHAEITATLGQVDSQAAIVTVLASTAVESVMVTADDESIAAGFTTELSAIATYEDGHTANVTHIASWQSLNQAVASVSKHGLASGLSLGTATMNATFDGTTGSYNLTVTDALLESMTMSPKAVSLPAGVSQQFEAMGAFSDGSHQDISGDVVWESANPSVASVDPAGKAMGLSAGASTIKASMAGKQASALMSVSDAHLVSMWIEPMVPPALVAGSSTTFSVMGIYTDGTELELTANDHISWSSSDAYVAQISNAAGSEGMVVGKSAGVTEIGALYNDGTTTMVAPGVSLSVSPAQLEAMAIVPLEASVVSGKMVQFAAMGTYSDGSQSDITGAVLWKSSHPAHATIDQAGLATGMTAGGSTISATLQGMDATAALVVTPAELELVMLAPTLPDAVPVGGTLMFKAFALYTDGAQVELTESDELTWHSSDPDVASVSNATGEAGLLTALSVGGTHVFAICNENGTLKESPPVLVSVIQAGIVDMLLEPATANLPIGMQHAFVAMATFTDGSIGDVTDSVMWKSSDPEVAAVNDMGVTTGFGLGVALITAQWQDVIASAPLTVTPQVLAELAIAPQEPAAVPVGLDREFTVMGTFSDGSQLDMTTHPKVTWTSSDPAVASIDQLGLATGADEGGTLITAVFDDASGQVASSPVLLSVVPALLEGIVVDPLTASTAAGSTAQFFATGTFSDGTSADISNDVLWTSGDPALATVDNDGTAHGQSPGGVEITATAGELTATAMFTVTDAELVSVQLEPAAPADLPVGLTQAFSATGLYTDGSTADLTMNPDLTWTSSSPAIAAVDNAAAKGMVTGLAEGGADIGAVFDDGEITVAAKAVPLSVVPALLESIALDPVAPSVPHGFDVAFTATGTFSDGTITDLTTKVEWSSSNKGVASLSTEPKLEGVATGHAPGSAQITAAFGGQSAMTTLQVTAADLVSIAVNPPAADVAVGLTHQFEATGNFNDGSTMALTKMVTWSVHPADLGRGVTISNATGRWGLATVSTTAMPDLEPVTLLATLGSVSGVAQLTIVNPVTLIGIQVDVADNVIPIGLGTQATALGLYSDGVHPPEVIDITEQVTWEPDNSSVVAVSNAAGSKGRVTGLNAGVSLVNACLGAVCANDFLGPGSAELVFVTACPFGKITIEPNGSLAKKLPRGTSRKYSAVANYQTTGALGCALLTGVTYDVTELSTWTSSNTAVATVSNKTGNRGFVQAAQAPPAAQVKIRAIYGVLEDELNLMVIDACVESIVVSPPAANLPAGVRKQFGAVATLTDGGTIDFTDLATWQVTGDIGLVDPGFIQTFPGDAGALKAVSKGTSQCPKVVVEVPVTINGAELLSIGVDPPELEVAIGSTAWLAAQGFYSDGTTFDLTDLASWSSINPAVASAGASGKVKGKKAGNVIVLATAGKVTGTSAITVDGLDLVKITVQPSGTFPCGDFGGKGYMAGVMIPYQATAHYSDGSTTDATGAVTWMSDSGKVDIGANGHAMMVSAGNAVLSASMDGVVGKTTAKVVPSILKSIKVKPGNNFVIPVDSTQQFSATGTYQATLGGAVVTDTCSITQVVSWAAAPGASLAIDGAGLATATATPTNSATVTAQKGAVVRVVTGKVTGACVEDVVLDPAGAVTTVGISKQFRALAVLSDGSTFEVTDSPVAKWASTNPAVAGVLLGMVEPVAPGLAEIVATYKAGSAGCSGVPTFVVAKGVLQVTPAALTDIAVTCHRANQTWPGPFGPVKGLPAGLKTPCFAIGTYVDGTTADITEAATWSSSNADVVSVSNAALGKGIAATLSEGFANLTAEFGGVTGSLSFGVVSATLDQINVGGAGKLPAGFSEPFMADARFTLGTVSRWYDITELANWVSTDPTIALVDNDPAGKGLVTTLSAGGPIGIEAGYLGVTGARMVIVLDVTLDRIELDPASRTLALGQKLQWHADGVYLDSFGGAYVKDITHLVSWFTTAPELAAVDAAGLVSTHGVGDVAIVAELGAASGDADLSVEDKCVTEIAINPEATALPAGVPLTFQVIAQYTTGAPQDVTDQVVFKTSDAGRMAAPDANGWTFSVVGASPGVVEISAKLHFGGCSGKPVTKSTVTVNAAVLDEIMVYGNPPIVPVGLKVQFTAFGLYSDGSSYDITRTIDAWKSGNKTVATVANGFKNRGGVTGVAMGTAPITATQETMTGGSTVSVTQAQLLAMDVRGFRTAGHCRSFTHPLSWLDAGWAHPQGAYVTWARAIGTFSDGSTSDLTQAVSWASGTPSRAQVSNAPGFQGRVTTGVVPGEVDIVATHSSGVSGALELDVVDAFLDLLVLNPSGPDPVKLALGNSHQLELRGRFAGAFYCVTENGAYVDDGDSVVVSNSAGSRGLVNSDGLGDSVVTAFIGTVNDTILVQVTDPTLDWIEIVPDGLAILVGETAQLRAYGHFSDGTVNEVTWNGATTWSVADPGVVDLTATKGLVLGIGQGTSNVDACLTGICASASTHEAMVTVDAP